VPRVNSTDIDGQLVARAQAGDVRAFELLVEKYRRRISRLLGRIIRDQSAVEDVTQEAFIKAYRAIGSFRGDSAFYTWLYRIAVNAAKNHLASTGRRAPATMELVPDGAEGLADAGELRDINTPESLLMSKEIAETVNKAIDALPGELKQAIQLRELEGMSYEEIARILDCPVGTVRSRIFRAREAIAASLKPLLGVTGNRRW
jgi:RNA polymerase sigma factor RpoE